MNNSSKKVVLLDGSLGQELVNRSNKPATRLWAAQAMFDDPALVVDLHKDYIKAGARLLTLNAYSLTPERLDRVGLADQFEAMQHEAIKLVNEAKDSCAIEGVSIAGCLPPLVGSYRPEDSPDFDTSVATYSRIVEIQAEHVDVILCETVSSIADARSVVTAAMASGKPVWVALSVADDGTGTLRSGESVSEAVKLCHDLGVEVTLLNCSKPESFNDAWPEITSVAKVTGAYANGFTSIAELLPGKTTEVLSAREDLGPEQYADYAMQWVEGGAAVIGGCCEVGPEHIRVLARRLEEAGYVITGTLDS